MKTKTLLLLNTITYNGTFVEVDEVIELPEKSAQALIEEGKAKEVKADKETKEALDDRKSDGEDSPHLIPSDGKENAGEDEATLSAKALDDKFNRDALAEVAKQVGVEFPYNAKKGEIIRAVLEAEKADVLLEK
ncbi:hypothetical protein [Cytobacillus horneckiae]|uniref:hypothetical protein n=1 Tax=Cytobacillus horneckiae TaxID=549687 RepID=UPI003D9A45B7